MTQLHAADLDGEQTKLKPRCWSCKRARRQEALELQTHSASCMYKLHVGCTQPPLQHREHVRELLNNTIASRCYTEKLGFCVCAHSIIVREIVTGKLTVAK